MRTAVAVASAGMLLPSKRERSRRSGVRAALGAARETYRRYSTTEHAEPDPPPKPQPAAGRRLPALAARGTQLARRLREHQLAAGTGEQEAPETVGTPAETAERPEGAETVPTPEPVATTATTATPTTPVGHDDPDVVLDIPHLHVDEIDLKLDELKARVALEARVMDLLRLDVGVDADLRGVGLTIKGVDAQALLKVRLENLTVILDRVMDTVDRNPQLLERLAEHVGATLREVGSGAERAVGELGAGAGSAVGDVGRTASSSLGDLAESAGAAVEEVGGIARDLAPGASPPSDGPPRGDVANGGAPKEGQVNEGRPEDPRHNGGPVHNGPSA